MWAVSIGVVNAGLSLIVLLTLRRHHTTGFFAYAPLNESVPVPSSSPPTWALFLVPVAFLVLNGILVFAAARRTDR